MNSDLSTLPGLSALPAAGALMPRHDTGGEHADDQAMANWLVVIRMRNANTFRSYSFQVTRFRVFLHAVHASNAQRPTGHLMRDATEADVLLYEAYLRGHLPDGTAVEPLRVPTALLQRYGLAHQPFVVGLAGEKVATNESCVVKPVALANSSVNTAISILHALYEYWLEPDPATRTTYVGANPVRRVKRSSSRAQRQKDRNVPLEGLRAMLAHAQHLIEQADSPAERVRRARMRWIAVLLFGLWARRSEIAKIRMCDFFTANGRDWYVRLRRKGGIEQDLPVAEWIISALIDYRQTVGLPALPGPDDTRAAVMNLLAQNAARISDDTIYDETLELARDTARAILDGQYLEDALPAQRQYIADKLRATSPHWFRHTGASIAINAGSISLEDASKYLGHSGPAITAAMYWHPEDDKQRRGIAALGKIVLNNDTTEGGKHG